MCVIETQVGIAGSTILKGSCRLAGKQLWLIEWPERAAGAIPAADLVIELSHAGPARDIALRALTPANLRYVGLIGSKAKVKRIFDALRDEGATPEMLSRVHAPIGLDIGAITPQEIAVSILAELIAVKHGKIAEPNVAAVSMRWEGALKK